MFDENETDLKIIKIIEYSSSGKISNLKKINIQSKCAFVENFIDL